MHVQEAKAHAVGPNNLLWSNEAVWAPDGDTAQLRDPAGRVVSSVHGHPTPRLPEGSAAKHLKFAPGSEEKVSYTLRAALAAQRRVTRCYDAW
jgi:hypothetical protein